MSSADSGCHTDPAPLLPDPVPGVTSGDEGASPRQLLVFCDGTNNTFNGGTRDTNVLKLAEGIKRCNSSDPHQFVWYDPGVGAAVNLPEATLRNQLRGYLQRLWGLAFGDGVYENIAQAISFLATHYQDGDQIFLFGFSRGAFTARAVGGVINQYGLPHPSHLHLLPLLIQRYFSAANKQSEKDQAIVAQALLMTQARRPFIHFVGVWDTVDEVGFPIPGLTRRIRNSNTLADKCFVHVRHVVALDEHRRLFRPRLYEDSNAGHHTVRIGKATHSGTLKQVALPGCHSDIGGGYEAAGLSDLSLAWMLSEATSPEVGLRVGALEIASEAEDAAPVQVHSELQSAFGWALLGQSVRDAGGAFETLRPPEGHEAPPRPVPSVWQQRGCARPLWWGAALVLVVLSFASLIAVSPPGTIPQWQLLAGVGGPIVPPVSEAMLVQHLWLDTFALIPSLALLLSLANSAAFSRLAGQRAVGQVAPKWLNLLGRALPLYLAADLLENASTALLLWLLNSGGWLAYLTALFMSLAAFFKYLGFAGAMLLAVWGWYAGGLRQRN